MCLHFQRALLSLSQCKIGSVSDPILRDQATPQPHSGAYVQNLVRLSSRGEIYFYGVELP